MSDHDYTHCNPIPGEVPFSGQLATFLEGASKQKWEPLWSSVPFGVWLRPMRGHHSQPLTSSTAHLGLHLPHPHAGKGSWLGSPKHLSCQKMEHFGELWAKLHSAFEKREGAFSPFKSITRCHVYLGAPITFLFL